MDYVRLGKSGLSVSRICLGMMSFGSPDWQPWVLPGSEGEAFVRAALDCGINFFDTADFYSLGQSEEVLGAAVARLTDRHKVVIATKVGLPMGAIGPAGPAPNDGGLSRKHIFAAVDASLRRLKTDYIDLYQLHRADPATPIEETVEALKDLVQAGKILYFGATNFAAWQFAKAVYHGRYRAGLAFASVQVQYNLVYREDARDLIPLCIEEGIGCVGYSPLARGWLAGIRSDGAAVSEREARRAAGDAKAQTLYGTEADRQTLDRLVEIARARGVSSSEVAYAWILSHPFMASVVCGPLEPSHLDTAVAALDIDLSQAERDALDAVYVPRTVKDDALGAVTGVRRGATA